jgi:receptor-type tyrosine-protein phosphatase gamma
MESSLAIGLINCFKGMSHDLCKIFVRVAFKPRNAIGSDAVKEIRLKDPSVTKYTIQKLEIFTQYLVSLQVYNPEGLGPSTTVVVMTDEGSKFIHFF